MPIATPIQKFTHELGYVYDSEFHFLDAMSQLKPHAQSPSLRAMLREHSGQAEGQIRNLEGVFAQIGFPAARVLSTSAAGLVAESVAMVMEAVEKPTLRDCAIAGAQAKVEAQKAACDRSLVAGAALLGREPLSNLLIQNLEQEVRAMNLAESHASVLPVEAQAATPGARFEEPRGMISNQADSPTPTTPDVSPEPPREPVSAPDDEEIRGGLDEDPDRGQSSIPTSDELEVHIGSDG